MSVAAREKKEAGALAAAATRAGLGPTAARRARPFYFFFGKNFSLFCFSNKQNKHRFKTTTPNEFKLVSKIFI